MKKSIKGVFTLLLVALTAIVLVACDNNPTPTPTEIVEVTFVMNEGTPVVPKQTFDKGGKATKPSQDPTRAGYTFGGWYEEATFNTEFNFNKEINENTSIYAKWTVNSIVEYTVTFNAGDGEVDPESSKVVKDALVQQPTALYIGYELVGWFKDAEHTQAWNFATDKVTENITLYAKWNEKEVLEGTAITSQQQLYDLFTNPTPNAQLGSKYYLAADLDFSQFTWDVSTHAQENHAGMNLHINGNGKKISNVTMTGAKYGGIIPLMSGGSVTNVTLENIKVVDATDKAAILVGRVLHGSTVSFNNVTILDSNVNSSAVGVGTLIGHLQGQNALSTATISNIVVLNTNLSSSANAIGGLIGDVESSIANISDVLIDVAITTSGERVGGVIGEVRKNGSTTYKPDFSIKNAVIRADLAGLRYVAGLVGRADGNMSGDYAGAIGDIADAIVVVNIQTSHLTDSNNGLIARSNVNPVSNVWGVAFNYDRAEIKGIHVSQEFLVKDIDSLPATAKVNFNDDWDFDALSFKGYALDLGHKVSLTVDNVTTYQYVKDGKSLSQVYVSNPDFESWLLGEELYTNQAITADTTLVAKLVTKNLISFDVDGGTSMPSVSVVEGQLPPVLADAVKEGYSFKGWFTDAELTNAYEPAPLTESITLYAKFEDDIDPVIVVTPDRGDVTLLPGETFKLVITMDDVEPHSIEVDHSLETILPEFKVYANVDNPYGSAEARDLFVERGVQVTYNATTKTWTIDFGTEVTELFIENNITFYLVAKDESGNSFGSMYDVTAENTFAYEVVVKSNVHTITFDSNNGSLVDDIIVPNGETFTLPVEPTKSGFTFAGWFTDSDLTNAYEVGAVSSSFTLYAKWEEKTNPSISQPIEGSIAISSLSSLLEINDWSKNYHLTSDINMSSVQNFQGLGKLTGRLDGQGYTISSLVFNGTTDQRLGLFNDADGGTIINIVISNFVFSNTAAKRGAFLVGDASGTNVSRFENISILNSSIVVAEYGSSVVGRTQAGAIFKNILIDDVTITAKYAGGITADINTSASVLIEDVWVSITFENSKERVGGLVGRSREAGSKTVNRAFVEITVSSTDKWAAGIVADSATNFSVNDVIITGSIGSAASGGRSIAGNGSTNVSAVRAFEYSYSNLGKDSGLSATKVDELSLSWWQNNLPSFGENDLWTYDSINNIYVLFR